jgi:hypothetical protein
MHPSTCGVDLVEPLWEMIDKVPDETASQILTNALPPLRFFVDSEDTFERVYEEAAVAVYWEQELG